jgi:hypothetical protein
LIGRIAFSIYAAFSVLMLLGAFVPLRMLPLVLLQLLYKLIWIVWIGSSPPSSCSILSQFRGPTFSSSSSKPSEPAQSKKLDRYRPDRSSIILSESPAKVFSKSRSSPSHSISSVMSEWPAHCTTSVAVVGSAISAKRGWDLRGNARGYGRDGLPAVRNLTVTTGSWALRG